MSQKTVLLLQNFLPEMNGRESRGKSWNTYSCNEMTIQSKGTAYSRVDPSRKDCFKDADKIYQTVYAGLWGGHGGRESEINRGNPLICYLAL